MKLTLTKISSQVGFSIAVVLMAGCGSSSDEPAAKGPQSVIPSGFQNTATAEGFTVKAGTFANLLADIDTKMGVEGSALSLAKTRPTHLSMDSDDSASGDIDLSQITTNDSCKDAFKALSIKYPEAIRDLKEVFDSLKSGETPTGMTKQESTDKRSIISYKGEGNLFGMKLSSKFSAGANDNGIAVMYDIDMSMENEFSSKTNYEVYADVALKSIRIKVANKLQTKEGSLTIAGNSFIKGGELPSIEETLFLSGTAEGQAFNIDGSTKIEKASEKLIKATGKFSKKAGSKSESASYDIQFERQQDNTCLVKTFTKK